MKRPSLLRPQQLGEYIAWCLIFPLISVCYCAFTFNMVSCGHWFVLRLHLVLEASNSWCISCQHGMWSPITSALSSISIVQLVCNPLLLIQTLHPFQFGDETWCKAANYLTSSFVWFKPICYQSVSRFLLTFEQLLAVLAATGRWLQLFAAVSDNLHVMCFHSPLPLQYNAGWIPPIGTGTLFDCGFWEDSVDMYLLTDSLPICLSTSGVKRQKHIQLLLQSSSVQLVCLNL